MPDQSTFAASLGAKLTTDPIFRNWPGGLLTQRHIQPIIQASIDSYHAGLPAKLIPVNESIRTDGWILPEGDFDALVSSNPAIKQRGPIFKKTLWALYRDMLDRDATHLFWRMYYCHRKALVLIDGKQETKRQSYCRSMFCPTCRDRNQKARRKRALDRFGDQPHDRLYSLTILYKCLKNLDGIKAMVDEFKGEMIQALNSVDQFGVIECQGAMELDYKHPSLFKVTALDGGVSHRTHCQQALAAMGVDLDSPLCPDSWWLLHYHAIIFVEEGDASVVGKVLHNAFPGAHLVRMKALHPEHMTPKLESIKNLCQRRRKISPKGGVKLYHLM